MNQKDVLLATIEAALDIRSQTGSLSAPEVNDLGRQLGLSNETTLHLVRQLSEEGEVNLEWGGSVSIARRELGAPSVYLGPNATYIGEGAKIQNSAVGSGARVKITHPSPQIPIEGLLSIVAGLTVSIERLTAALDGMAQAQRQSCEQLVELARAVQTQLLQNDAPDKHKLQESLDEADKALGVVEKAGKLGTAAAPYLPQVWNILHHAFQSLSAYLGGL